MFENLIAQPVKKTLIMDIKNNRLPPSILFSGKQNSGKLTAALELARVLSCTENGEWTCGCNSCKINRELNTADVLIMGTRDCSLEIRAAAKAFLETPEKGPRFLFLRAIKKLTMRFDPRLWDTDETRFSKAAPLLTEIDECITEINELIKKNDSTEKLKKYVEKILKASTKIQEDCMYDVIPVNQVRKASSWIRLMPSGKKKFLIIENADKMQESARNAFLKILEEPPEYAFFILTTSNRGAIMQTILSRVRPYTFIPRTYEDENDIIARVFRDKDNSKKYSLTSYLYNFLPVELSVIKAASILFWQIVIKNAHLTKKTIPDNLKTEVENFTEIQHENKNISDVLNMINKGKPHTVFLLFLESIASIINNVVHKQISSPLEIEAYTRISKLISDAKNQNEIYNLSAQAVLENLLVKILETL